MSLARKSKQAIPTPAGLRIIEAAGLATRPARVSLGKKLQDE